MEADDKQEFSQTNGKLLLWLGLLLSPVAWAVQLQSAYILTVYACQSANFLPIHIVSFAALILSLIGAAISWRRWKKAGSKREIDESIGIKRKRFMAILGILNGALFSLLILAQWVPSIIGVPCDK
jgi:hypothetical protein